MQGEVVLDRGLALARVLEVDNRASRDDDLGRYARRRHALRDQIFHLLAHLGLGVGDAEQPHAASPEDALPVEARRAAPAVVADVEVGNLVFEVGGVGQAEPDLVNAGDVDHPDAVARREVVHGLRVERIHHRHAAEPYVLREQIQKASPRRHHPRALPGVDGPFENGAGAGKAERGPPAELLAVAFALRHLQHARRAVDVGRGVPAGEEGHILQKLGIEQAHRATGRREVREGVDVGNLHVVDHEQVLERAAAADDDVVAEIVAADCHARQALHVAGHVLQSTGALEDFTRLHDEARVLHLSRRLKRRGRHGDGLLHALHSGEGDFHGAVQPGAHVHRVAGERQTLERQNLQPIGVRTQFADTEGAPDVAGGAGGGVEGAHAHALSRLASGVHDDAADGAHTGGVLCRRGGGDEEQHDRGQSSHATRPPMRTSSCW